MEYQTRRTYKRGEGLKIFIVAIAGIICCFILSSGLSNQPDDIYIIMGYLLINIIFIGLFIYYWSDKYFRSRYFKYGVRYDAKIIGAEYALEVWQDSHTYFLIIEFNENGRVLRRKTQGYVGNPNIRLKSPSCSIYKWKGKYMEGDFKTSDRQQCYCNIPIQKYHFSLFKQKDYV